MRSYELVFVVHPTVDEEGLTGLIERAKSLVERSGGTVVTTEPWGLRRLSYPVQNVWEGQYVLMQFEMEPQGVAVLERSFKMLEGVMRHLVVLVQ